MTRLSNAGIIVVTLLMLNSGILARTPVTSLLELRQKNVIMQEWDLSCGAATLTTLLNYQHGINVTEKEVATELIGRKEYIDNPDLLKIRQGFSLLDLKKYVDKRGLTGNGYGQLNMDNLIQLAPVLVPIQLQGYNHFVIFRGIAGNRVLLADPAWGNRIMMKDKFVDAWIDFGPIGRVGFTVTAKDQDPVLNQLAPGTLDFVMLR